MKTSILKQPKLSISIALLSVLFFSSQSTIASVKKDATEKNHDSVENLISGIIKKAEKSVPIVDIDREAALQYVEEALVSVKQIKTKLSDDTHAEAKSPLLSEESKEYWFVYPRVNKNILSNASDFPILNAKYSSGVLYRGDSEDKVANQGYAYFDYPFAYASLKTAKDALQANELKRAKIAIKWVFEAVYITPDFLISINDQKQENSEANIESFININGGYPVYS